MAETEIKRINGRTVCDETARNAAKNAQNSADAIKVPTKVSELQNDSEFITISVATLLNYYLKTEVYARTETYSQTEINNLIDGLDKRLNAVADSDDTTLDQLSEIVAYIKANKSLIDSVTTSKVSVTDIIDNLTTSVSNKPLSAGMGAELKKLYDSLKTVVDAITIPAKLPNPNALTFTGAVTDTYDGSTPLTVNIPTPEGGTTAVYMRVSEGYIQYSTDNAVWNNIIAVADLKGEKGDDYVLTEADKTEIAEEVKNSLTTEEWTFTLEDDSTAVKKVVLA